MKLLNLAPRLAKRVPVGLGMTLCLMSMLFIPGLAMTETNRVEIQVRQTPSPDDDYLTWAPADARVRVRPGTTTSALEVVLTNEVDFTIDQRYDNRPYNGHGSVLFDHSERLPWGKTAEQPSLALTLPPNGDWVNFQVAGEFKHPSAGSKDAVIVVHQGERNGPVIGRLQVMVRIRKNAFHLSDKEKENLLDAIDKLHNERNEYVPFVQLHYWARWGIYRRGSKYGDQGHLGPVFLPWHRIYLLYVERKLQSINPAVSLAYWVQSEDNYTDRSILTKDFMGKPTGCTSGPIQFDANNPLLSWKVPERSWWTRRPDNTREPSTEPIRRNDKSCGTKGLRRTDELLKHTTYNKFHAEIEQNPHNLGHRKIGGQMMNNWSPIDPLFMLFHSYHDKVWAQWQWQRGHFCKGEGACDTAVYEPQGTFPGKGNHLRGAHLLDPMWPWNGLAGVTKPECTEWTKCKGRQPPKQYEEFAASTLPGVWPGINTTATPTPKDAIDYLGMNQGMLDMGFAYDDVPYGVAPEAPLVAMLSAVQSEATMLSKAKAFIADPSADEHLRLQAINMTLHDPNVELLSEMIRILKDPEDGSASFDVQAIQTLHLLGMTLAGKARMGDIHAAIRGALQDQRPSVRKEAIRMLAAKLDPAAIDMLKADLYAPNPLFTKPEALRLLSISGEEHDERLRPFLKDTDPEIRQAAVEALSNDPASYDGLLSMMSRKDEAAPVRIAAIQALMSSSHLAFINAAFGILDDPTAEVAVQEYAIAGLGVFARSNASELSAEQLKDIADKLFNLSPEQKDQFDRSLIRALELTYDATIRKN